MSRAPSKWKVVGQKVLDEVRDKAPEEVKRAFANIVTQLTAGPYPGVTMPHATPAPGIAQNHLYVAWEGDVEVMYLVMQDQPVVSLVAVHWPRPAEPSLEGSPEASTG